MLPEVVVDPLPVEGGVVAHKHWSPFELLKPLFESRKNNSDFIIRKPIERLHMSVFAFEQLAVERRLRLELHGSKFRKSSNDWTWTKSLTIYKNKHHISNRRGKPGPAHVLDAGLGLNKRAPRAEAKAAPQAEAKAAEHTALWCKEAGDTDNRLLEHTGPEEARALR